MTVPSPRHPNESPDRTRFGEAELLRLRSGDRATRDRLWEALDRAIRDRILPQRDRVAPRFRTILPDVSTAEDFIADRIVRIIEGLASGEVGRRFDERSGDLVGYLTQTGMLFRKALQWRGSRPLDEQALAAASDDGRDDPLANLAIAPGASPSDERGRAVRRLLAGTFRPDLAEAGGPTQRGFVAAQFWPRLDPAGRDACRREVETVLAKGGTTIVDLEREHVEARRRIARQLARVNAGREGGRVLAPRAEVEAERQTLELRVEALIHPLDAAAIRRLLGTSEDNAHQLKRRLVANLRAILPDLAAFLAPATDGDDP